MIGDVIAWILGIASVAVLAAAERRRMRKKREYRSELIGIFTEDPEGQEEEKDAHSS